MKLVCIDTAGAEVVIAACATGNGGGHLVAGDARPVRAQALLEVLDDVLREGGWERGSVDAIAVGVGPGGFTGVRVGVATARGLAEALGVPLHPVSSLAALMASDTSVSESERSAWVLLDARRGEHFAQRFERTSSDSPWQPASEATTIANADIAALDGHLVQLAAPTPAGLVHAAAAVLRAATDASGDPFTVVPDYVRAPDAEPPRPRLRIDDMRFADLPAVVAIEERCFPSPWSSAMYEQELTRCAADRGVALVARDLTGGARVVGAVLAAWMGDSWHIMNVLVDPPARRRGIAAQLLDELLTCTERHPLGTGDGWTLEVREANQPAIALYESRGFVNRGLRPGYYADTGEAAVIMWRETPTSTDAQPSPTTHHVEATT